ncbi:MAG: phage late control D family protein [Hungatella sp.]|jgi:hypothetical protein|nr:phage late control D family protein [Hungatella sp.]
MREERLIVRPFEDLEILDYRSGQQVNDHAQVHMKGRIPIDRKEDYMKLGKRQTWVQVIAISGKEEAILFYGLMEKLRMEVAAGNCMVELDLCSGTKLMDYEDHTRSFQEDELTYSSLLDICNQGYEEAAKIMTEGNGKKINRFIMQYGETDWEFIKRLASMNHTVVFADCSTKGERYHFGIPDRKGENEGLAGEYWTQYDMQEYWNKKKHGLSVQPEDMMSSVWETREIHKLGERIIVDGRELFIWKIDSCLKGNELYHTVFMKSRRGLQEPLYDNVHIAGVSLLGNVVKVKDEKVQITIQSDENAAECGMRWYSFSTVYSSPDGTGWYCMPEIGDTIRLYFPVSKETEAYVASAYHEGDARLRKNPECKFLRNKEGKEVQLSPGRILMTNNDGTFIELSDEEGINIVSEGSVNLRSEGSVSITSSNSSITMSAPKKVTVKRGDSVLNLNGDLTMEGSKIML